MPRRRTSLTPLDHAVLAILVRGENYCHAMTNELAELTGTPQFETSVNRALVRLAKEGWLSSRWEFPDPDAGPAHQGPPRRYFELTAEPPIQPTARSLRGPAKWSADHVR